MQDSTKGKQTGVICPVLMMTVGLGWLFTVWNVDVRIHWVPVLGMAVTGALVLLLGGLDKVTVVLGPLLLITTFFALLRQTGYISFDVELPCLLFAAGLLMLMAHLAPIPTPRWLVEQPCRG